MRKTPRFKTYTKSKLFLLSCPKKLLKFKKSKWVSYKNTFQKNLKKRFFFNYFLSSTRLQAWEKKKFFFKQNLINQRHFLQLYDTCLKMKRLKKEMKNFSKKPFQINTFFTNSFLRFEFRLAVLLVRLKFFFNVFEAKKYISAGKILVNSCLVSSNYTLKQGDIIKFKDSSYFSKKILSSFSFTPTFISFVEIDYYLNQIVVIKSVDLLSLLDTSLLIVKPFNLSRLRHFYFKN